MLAAALVRLETVFWVAELVQVWSHNFHFSRSRHSWLHLDFVCINKAEEKNMLWSRRVRGNRFSSAETEQERQRRIYAAMLTQCKRRKLISLIWLKHPKKIYYSDELNTHWKAISQPPSCVNKSKTVLSITNSQMFAFPPYYTRARSCTAFTLNINKFRKLSDKLLLIYLSVENLS